MTCKGAQATGISLGVRRGLRKGHSLLVVFTQSQAVYGIVGFEGGNGSWELLSGTTSNVQVFKRLILCPYKVFHWLSYLL